MRDAVSPADSVLCTRILPRLCDVLGRVEGEASVPRVVNRVLDLCDVSSARLATIHRIQYGKPRVPRVGFAAMPHRRQTLSYVLAFSPQLCDVLFIIYWTRRRRGERSAFLTINNSKSSDINTT